ncbi:hypothetical protein DBV08_21115 [Rhodococcus sp. KBW08]|nr:hypothetical protein DBV08_21115 [Rhodococcus sp. KBW08]
MNRPTTRESCDLATQKSVLRQRGIQASTSGCRADSQGSGQLGDGNTRLRTQDVDDFGGARFECVPASQLRWRDPGFTQTSYSVGFESAETPPTPLGENACHR